MDHNDNVSVIARSNGHLRIGIPRLYRSQPVQKTLETELSRHPGVIEVHASPLTGRVLLLFDPALSGDALLAELGFSIDKPDTKHKGSGAASASLPQAREHIAAPSHTAPAPSRTPLYPPWHLRSIDESLAYHASSLQAGLSREEAQQRLRQGLNMIPPPPRVSALAILLNQFKTMPVILLGVSAAVSVLTGAVAEAAAIGAVLILNGGIGFTTERQAEATIASLSELVDDGINVLRDGAVEWIDSSQVVPGDILVLAPGTRIAADVRLLQAHGLMIDESPLTGESFPVSKDATPLASTPPLAERRNMAYRGTAVSMGTGLGLVVGTGSRTEAGAIDALTSTTIRPKTPIQIQLDHLGNQLITICSAMCLGIFGLGLLRAYNRTSIFRTAVALAVAAVPEGLPAVATTSLARGLRRMREQYVLIRHLHAVETIGAVQIICLDKTGTLTMNQMSAVAVQSVGHALDPERASADGEDDSAPELSRLLQVCVLCNQSAPADALPDSPLQGSATENALLQLAARAGMQAAPLRERFPLLSTELRAEGRNYMCTVHAMPDSQQLLWAVKGNPDEVLGLCTTYQDGATVSALDEAARQRVARQNDQMANRQLRVLGMAYAETDGPPEPGDGQPPLTWVGLVGLADPLRPGMVRVIERFHEAGIRPIMLTGDQAGTAYVIGKALHLNNGEELNIVNSEELDRIAPGRLRELAAQAHVFSRVTPSDKLRIVQALQGAGATVAMTGDGINDGPALRAADVGIAMGGGTAVALSVADIALEHDQLEALLDAISQGRTIAANIRKAVHFLVSSNLSEILVVFGAVALGDKLPLSPMQLLWLNLLTDLLPAIALAAEPAEDDAMRRAPRDPRENLVRNQDMLRYGREAAVLAAGPLAAYAFGTMRHGTGERATTIAFDSLVLGQLLHTLFCRSERRRSFAPGAPPNPRLMLAIAASLGLQVLAHLVPGLRRLLSLSPLDPLDMLAVAAGAGVPLLVNELGRPEDQSNVATSARAERSTSFSTSAPTTLSATRSAAAAAALRLA